VNRDFIEAAGGPGIRAYMDEDRADEALATEIIAMADKQGYELDHAQRIKAVLDKFGEPMAGNTWDVHGKVVIYHACLERIAVKAGIEFDTDVQVLRAQRDEAVIKVVGRMQFIPDEKDAAGGAEPAWRVEWSIGEAAHVHEGERDKRGNYRTKGNQSAYPYAMAEKRAKDRVILKLIELHGLVYSEDEADEFKQEVAAAVERDPEQEKIWATQDQKIRQNLDEANTITKVMEYVKDPYVIKIVEGMPQPMRDAIREYSIERLKALGWVSSKSEKNSEKAKPAERREPAKAEITSGTSTRSPTATLDELAADLAASHDKAEIDHVVRKYAVEVQDMMPPDKAEAEKMVTERRAAVAKKAKR
jgi:hypothetical protein